MTLIDLAPQDGDAVEMRIRVSRDVAEAAADHDLFPLIRSTTATLPAESDPAEALELLKRVVELIGKLSDGSHELPDGTGGFPVVDRKTLVRVLKLLRLRATGDVATLRIEEDGSLVLEASSEPEAEPERQDTSDYLMGSSAMAARLLASRQEVAEGKTTYRDLADTE